jgi:hypothetical protein
MQKNLFFQPLRLFVPFLLLVGTIALQGQSYYQPGTTYTFRSLKSAGSTSVLSVVFDANGHATVSRSQVSSNNSDKQTFQVLAPLNEITTGTNSTDGDGEVGISGQLSKYWLISFDAPATDARPNNTITISGACKPGNGSAKSSVSYMLNGNNLNATCVAESGCSACEMKTTVSTDPPKRISGGVLLLKANSVSIQ